MPPVQIKKDIYFVGAVDWDRRLFDSLIPLPDGTSYNSYLIKGDTATALIDTVNPPMKNVLFRHLEETGVKKIDYLVHNHAEPDHSGCINEVLEAFPDAKVVCTSKCKPLLVDRFMTPEDKFITVEDGQTIDLGGRTLEFIHTPWVHWPETMVTYLKEEKMLFSCDFFGSHLATTDLYVTDEGRQHEAAKRYFAEIMMPFRTIIQNNIKKVEARDIDIIAPSHGPMYDNPKFIIDYYKDWVSDTPKNYAVVAYVSMHGITGKMVSYLVERLARQGVNVQQFDLADTDIGKVAMSLVDAATLVIGTPTVLVGPHPAAAYAAVLANALRPKLKYCSIIGSYGWGGKAVETLAGLIPNLKVEVLSPVICKGHPKDADYKALDALADAIAAKHKENGFS